MVQKITENVTNSIQPILREAFGWPGYLAAYDRGKATFGFFEDTHLMGVIVCGLIDTPSNGRIGVVKYVATLKKVQGRGAASALTDAALAWFEEQKCDEVAACVEGYNTASSQLFEKRGFKPRPFLWQLKRYRWQLPKVWLLSNHFFDQGHFWWSKTEDDNDTPPLKPQGFWVFVLTLMLFVGFLMRQTLPLTLETVGGVFGGLVLISVIRYGPMVWTSRWLKYPLVYKGWETSVLLTAFVMWVMGGIFYAPGGLYPDKKNWREDQERRILANIHLPGLLSLSFLQIVWLGLMRGTSWLDGRETMADVWFLMISFALIFDVWFAFFPVDSFAGGRVRKVYPKVWVVIALSSLVTLFVAHRL